MLTGMDKDQDLTMDPRSMRTSEILDVKLLLKIFEQEMQSKWNDLNRLSIKS